VRRRLVDELRASCGALLTADLFKKEKKNG